MSSFKDSYDALDSLVNCYADYYDRKEAEKLIKQDLDKLGKIENLEEELGCPLEVVFKALKEGIIYETEKESKCILIPNLIYTQLIDDEFPDYYFVNYDLQNLENSLFAKLKDYGKTWFLKGERNEE